MVICGIVDLGSNTVRLSIYEYEGPAFKLLLSEKAMTGLAGYVQNGALSLAGIRAACQVLSAYRTLLTNFDIADMYVFATASLRNISNTEAALKEICTATGITVEVLSGSDEAALSFHGAVDPAHVAPGLLADIGGGSFEVVHYENGTITAASSRPVGSLSLYTGFVAGLFPTLTERKALRAFITRELSLANPAGLQCSELCGVGGTIRAVSKLANDVFHKDPDCRTLSAREVRTLYRMLKKGGKDALRQILHTTPERVHTILPGIIILNGIVKSYGVQTITASPCGVREGYLMERVMTHGNNA